MTHSQVQLGKNGITENFINTLRDHFRKHNDVKVTVLKGAGHERDKVKEYGRDITEKLGQNYTARIVGFTIFIKKWRKAVR